jgi:LAO/AO transport system kinase
MGGLHPKIIEISDLLKAFPFDYILVETVGVGQSEIEIAGLADVTTVVLVPEAGDEVQTMKAGLMEIADVFVVNKSDRPDADHFVRNLRLMLAPAFSKHYQEVPVVKTNALQKEGTQELFELLARQLKKAHLTDKRFWLLAERAYYLIEQKRMQDVDKAALKKEIEAVYQRGAFNLYQFIADK